MFIFHQRQFRLDAGGVAIHQKGNRAGRRADRHLRVAKAVLRAVQLRPLPNRRRGGVKLLRERIGRQQRVQRDAMLPNHAQHRLAVCRESGKRAALLRQQCAAKIRLPGQDRHERRGHVAPVGAVIRQSQCHEQRAEIRDA